MGFLSAGHLSYTLYINALEKWIKSSFKFFTENTQFSIVRDSTTSANELNHDLQLISRCAFQWKMNFNPDPKKPAEEIIFSHKRSRVDHPTVFFNNNELRQVNYHKHLTLDSKLTFVNQVIKSYQKLAKVLASLNSCPLLCRLKPFIKYTKCTFCRI